jgi:hypothetical protein
MEMAFLGIYALFGQTNLKFDVYSIFRFFLQTLAIIIDISIRNENV